MTLVLQKNLTRYPVPFSLIAELEYNFKLTKIDQVA